LCRYRWSARKSCMIAGINAGYFSAGLLSFAGFTVNN